MIPRSFLFLICLLHASFAESQQIADSVRVNVVQPFKDKTTSQFGFIDGRGDTVQAAQFDTVRLYGIYMRKDFWVVSKGKLNGAISLEGKWIFPCVYERIQFNRNFPDAIEVRHEQDGAFGLYGLDGKIIFSDNTLSVTNKGEYYKIRNDEEKVSIYKKDYSLLIPPVYFDVEVPDFYRDSIEYKNLLFTVHQNDLRGVINQKMELVLPLEHKYRIAQYCVVDGDTSVFFIHSRREGYTVFYGLLDANGNTLLETEYSNIESIYSAPYASALKTSPVFFVEKNGYVQAYDALKQRLSSPYLKLDYFGDYFTFEHYQDVSGVLDADLNEIYVQDKYLLFRDGNNYEGSDFRDMIYQNYGASKPLYLNADFPDSLKWVYQIDPGKAGENNRGTPVFIKKQPHFGLYNTKTKTELPEMHSALWSKSIGGTAYVWGVDMESDFLYSENNPKGPNRDFKLSVYDANFTLLAKYKLKIISADQRQFNLMRDGNAPVFYFENRSGKIGGIDAKGAVIVPFEMSSLRYRPLKRADYSSADYYIFKKKKGFGLLDPHGKEILPFVHDSLEVLDGTYLVGSIGDRKVCYDTLGNELCAGFDGVFVEKTYSSEFQKVNLRSIHCVMDNKLFVLERGMLQPIDSSRYVFHAPIIELFGKYVIGKDGVILNDGDKRLLREYHELFRLFDNEGNVIIYNVEGVETMELSGVKYIDSRDSDVHYRVLFASGTTGILHRFTGLWVIPPGKYAEIYPVHRTEDRYEVKDAIESENWYVIDTDGNIIFNTPFDYPFEMARDFTILRKSEKFGLLNESFELVVPIEYDWIHRAEGIYFLRKNDVWNVYSKDHGFMTQSFDEIALYKFREGVLVFKEDSIAYVDFMGGFIIPFVDTKTFTAQHKVTDFIDLPAHISNSRYNGWGIIPTELSKPLYDRISMENMLRCLRQKTTKNENFLFQERISKSFHSNPIPSYYQFGEVSTDLAIRTIMAGKNYYSCSEVYNRKAIYTPENNSVVNSEQSIIFKNYRITGDSLIPIQLQDLFKDSRSILMPRLEEMLVKTIMEQGKMESTNQNPYSIVYEMMKNFYLDEGGIGFRHSALEKGQIFLSSERLSEKFELIRPIN